MTKEAVAVKPAKVIAMPPRVFVAQTPTKWDADAERLVPLYSFDDAAPYGEVVVCLDETTSMAALRPFSLALESRLDDLAFGKSDYLVAVGSPVLISLAAYLCLDRNKGFLNLLTFDRRERGYVHTVIDVT